MAERATNAAVGVSVTRVACSEHALARAARPVLAAAMAAVVGCALATPTAGAATITVTSLANAGPGTLRAALETAPSGSTIAVPAGTIALASPSLTTSQSVTIVGAGAAATIISGSGATRVLSVTGSPTVTVEGLTIRDGRASGGAGILTSGGTLTVKGVQMLENHAVAPPKSAALGGAIEAGPGALNVIDSTLARNTAGEGATGFGGAIVSEEGASPGSFTLSIQRSVIEGNSAGRGGTGFGGGILVNSAKEGDTLSVSILDSTLAGNAAGGGGPGQGFGGGLEFDSGAFNTTTSLVIERTAITGNSAGGANPESPGFGGGVLYQVPEPSTPSARVLNTTFAGNSAGGGGEKSSGFGGGLLAEGPITLSFDTIAGNAAGGGGAKSFGGGVSLAKTGPVRATVLASNSGGDCLNSGKAEFPSEGDNLADDATCVLSGPGDKPGAAAGLGALGSNGGPTQTLLPQPGSALIEGGPASGCPATDQRGVARPRGGACDVGAVEVAPPGAATGGASGVTDTSATVSGTIANASAEAGSTFFQYGTSTAYGSQSGSLTLSPFVSTSAVATSITGLAPHTLYHYRAVASTPEGTAFGADATFTTPLPPPPTVSHLSQSHAVWRIGRAVAHLARRRSRRAPTGTVFSFELNEAASVELQVLASKRGRLARRRCVAPTRANAHRRRCSRSVSAGTITLAGHVGRDRVSFTGRLGADRALMPGSYTLVLTAVDSFGQASVPQRVKFKIVR